MLRPLKLAGVLATFLLVLAACDDRRSAPVGTMAVPVARFHQAGTATIEGSVRAPGGYAPRVVLAVKDMPMAGASVRLSALAGSEPARTTRTDASGSFAFEAVPTGRVWLVTAAVADDQGRPVTLKALVMPVEGGAAADLSLASTLLTEAVLKSGPPESLVTEGLEAALAQVAATLDPAALPEMADPEAVASTVAAIEADCTVAAAIAGIQGLPAPVCTPTPTPTPRPRNGGSGGGSPGGGSSGGGSSGRTPSAPSQGGLETTITISDGPRIIAPTPTPAP